MEEHLKIIPFKEPELTEEQLQELKEKEKRAKEECEKIKKRDVKGLKPRHHEHIWNHIKQTSGRD